jgi:two-component system sensor histidine kinase KdpD
MTEVRPDPQDLLARIQEEEAQQTRGRLTIFFGATAGVGKTYEMLVTARRLMHDGVDVVGGWVVTHGRKDTEALMEGLEILPAKSIVYKGRALEEFDLDAALARHPAVILVDELAHTNVEGSRHEKRWQDIDELLSAGIDVYTCMNVQHLESANDVVAQITGVSVHETVPDSILDKAYAVVLVDLPPDELIQRMHEGKIYLPEQTKLALDNFFRKGNLIALRELALRSTADRVDADMRKYRSAEAIKEVWPVAERILVCIGPSPLSYRLVRAARRMAQGLHAQWFSVFVETPATARSTEKDRNRIARTLQLAEQLGSQTTTLSGTNVPEEVLSYARRQNISKIIIGKPAKPRWREVLFGSVVDDLIRRSGNIDVYVITGDTASSEQIEHRSLPKGLSQVRYLYALGVVAAATALAQLMYDRFHLVNLVMVYQLAIVIIATRWGRGPSISSSLLSVLLFDYLFIPPRFSFNVSDTQYLVTLLVMLLTAFTLSTLASTVHRQAEMARLRERHTSALYEMSREQASALTKEGVLKVSIRHLNEVFTCRSVVFLPDDSGHLQQVEHIGGFDVDNKELSVAQWVFMNKQSAGRTTKTLPGSRALYVPMMGGIGIVGVIGIAFSEQGENLRAEELHLLETFVSQISMAVERAILSEQLNQATSRSLASVSAPVAAKSDLSDGYADGYDMNQQTTQTLLPEIPTVKKSES